MKSAFLSFSIVLAASVAHPGDAFADEAIDLQGLAGVCVQVGGSDAVTEQLAGNHRLLVHRLDADAKHVRRLQRQYGQVREGASVLVEHWTHASLPHADNSVNLLLADRPESVSRSEVERVLIPGGTALLGTGAGQERITKSRPDGMGEWTHQWGSAQGSLTSDDRTIGIPRGLQWLKGPLFAMDGRKSSTQSLVSAGGRNFYVTQNVLENVGESKMAQYLVARDAFNGMIHWMRPWKGPFVKGSGETNARLVASAETLYVVDEEGLLALNSANGEVIRSRPLEERPDKLVLDGELLLVQSSQGVTAHSRDLDDVRWEFRDRTVHGAAISEGRVLLLVSGRDKEGDYRHDLAALDLESGELLWRIDTRPHVSARDVRINFVRDGVVAVQAHGSMHVFAANSGEHVWSKKTKARPGKAYVDERFVGHFYRQGLVWMLLESAPRKRDGQARWVGLDPKTGQEQEVIKTIGDWPRTAAPAKLGCQLILALDDYIAIPRQATFIDIRTGEKHPFKFTRGGCGLGFVAANGLVYSHPHACGCFSEAIRGFMAVHSDETPEFEDVDASDRLQRGPAYGKNVDGSEASAEDWPMHRYGLDRGASSPVKLGRELRLEWSAPIAGGRGTPADREWELRTGSPLTAPTVVGDRVFVADVNRGRLLCLDRRSGDEMWSFIAAGRIDSPPTIHQGLCLFGARDGWVYAVSADEGELAWRFRASPVDQRIPAFGSLESRWPVSGTVLVQNGLVFAAAGRAPDADGGMHVYALDVVTGTPQWSARLDDEEFFGLCDYLVGDGEDVYLSNWRFSPNGKNGVARGSDHLRGGKVGLLEASWTKHELASRKKMQTWTAGKAAGQILAFSPKASVGYDVESRKLSYRGDAKWEMKISQPSQITALALTPRYVVAAGGKDRTSDEAGGLLWLIARDKKGKIVEEISLPSAASFDTLAVAGGRVFVSTNDGRLSCFAAGTR